MSGRDSITLTEAARRLGIGIETARKLCRDGYIRSWRLHDRAPYEVSAEHIDQIIADRARALSVYDEEAT